jgi:4-diphosphocytidyl-2-C-methyl-D-erythritol kinase
MSPADVDLRGLWLAVAKPLNEGVSTKEAYSGISPKQPTESLTELLRSDISEWQGSVVNDFEPHIFVAHPAIKSLKQKMLDAGALYSAMSGSGSAVFGLFADRPTLELGDDTFLHVEYIE